MPCLCVLLTAFVIKHILGACCGWVLGPDMNMKMVIVNPGNLEVLSNNQISFQHSMMMMGVGSGVGME